ncbi:MAG: phage tail protein, partial [Rhodospirillaceae bacterium]|nr:phage tail protein [Rhodospirillaceae bacterium]
MSNVISIRNNFPKVAAQLDRLGKEVGNKALVRALNDTVRQGSTAMARQISKEFRVKVADAKARLDVDYAKVKGGGVKFFARLLATRPGGLHNNDWRGM